MNFYGHAVLAHRVRPNPSFVFGSMLPDLASIVGAASRLLPDEVHSDAVNCGRAESPSQLSDGVRFHLLTDDAFHQHEAFAEILTLSRQTLRARGVTRGCYLAASHIGVEILLDATLVADTPALAAFRDAVALFEHPKDGFWSRIDPTRREPLVSRLLDGTLPERYGDDAFVARRIVRRLSPRPRLCPTTNDASEILRHLPELRCAVEARAETLIRDVSQNVARAFGAWSASQGVMDLS